MNNFIKSYIYRSHNMEAKLRSSSGAAFYELAKEAIASGYYICGCAWDEKLAASHIIGNSEKDLRRMQGSKYVQSDMGEMYREILSLLKAGNKVLFSGTPCQAIGIGKLAEKVHKRENLLTVAVICHGVPSPLAWESYKEWTNAKENDVLWDVNFRDKSCDGYRKQYTRYTYQSGKTICVPSYLPTNKYMEAGIVYNLSLRPSCAACRAKGYSNQIDIILGDWYAEYKDEGSLGTSCVCTYTEKGDKYVHECLSGLKSIDYAEIVRQNGFIEKSVILGNKRDKFFAHIRKNGFWDDVESLYPRKYPLKQFLVKCGLYAWLKGRK